MHKTHSKHNQFQEYCTARTIKIKIVLRARSLILERIKE